MVQRSSQNGEHLPGEVYPLWSLQSGVAEYRNGLLWGLNANLRKEKHLIECA